MSACELSSHLPQPEDPQVDDKGRMFTAQFSVAMEESSVQKSLWNCFRRLAIKEERLLAVEDN